MSIQHPTVFSAGNDQNAFNWIQRYEAICPGNGWNTEERQIRHLPSYLDGIALNWWFSSGFDPQRDDWDDVKSSFLNYFDKSRSNPLSLELQLQNRKMRKNESLASYYHDVVSMCNRVDPHMADAKKVKELIKGLPGVYAQMVFLFQPDNPAQLWEKLQTVEQSLTLANQCENQNGYCVSQVVPDKVPTQSKTLEELMVAVVNEISQMRDDLRRVTERNLYPKPNAVPQRFPPTRNADARPMCWSCGRAGHISRFCRSKQSQSEAIEAVVNQQRQNPLENRQPGNANQTQ